MSQRGTEKWGSRSEGSGSRQGCQAAASGVLQHLHWVLRGQMIERTGAPRDTYRGAFLKPRWHLPVEGCHTLLSFFSRCLHHVPSYHTAFCCPSPQPCLVVRRVSSVPVRNAVGPRVRPRVSVLKLLQQGKESLPPPRLGLEALPPAPLLKALPRSQREVQPPVLLQQFPVQVLVKVP